MVGAVSSSVERGRMARLLVKSGRGWYVKRAGVSPVLI